MAGALPSSTLARLASLAPTISVGILTADGKAPTENARVMLAALRGG